MNLTNLIFERIILKEARSEEYIYMIPFVLSPKTAHTYILSLDIGAGSIVAVFTL